MADKLARQEVLLVSSAIPCSLSPVVSRIHSCLFSNWRHTVSSKSFDTQISLVSTGELVLSHHARCALYRFRCNGHSLMLSSRLSRIGSIENPSCCACRHPSQGTFYLNLHRPATTLCAARSLVTLCLSTTFGQGPRKLPGFWDFMAFHHAPITRKRSGSNNKPIKGSHKRIGGHEMQDVMVY